MSSWMPCAECPCYYAPTSDCYRRPDEVIHVDDPTVCPEWCPQCDRNRFPGHQHGKFPYHRETCKGCYYDRENPALVPPSCQHYNARPMNADSGECPYYVRGRPNDGNRVPISNDEIAVVTRRFAEIICRGINDHDLSFWDVDTCMHLYSIGSCGGCHRFNIIRSKKGVFTVRLEQTKVGKNAWPYRMECVVDHAEIVDEYGYLFLYNGDNRHYNLGCVAIRIVDAEPVPVDTVDEDEEECCPVEDSVQTAVPESATEDAYRLTSLGEWFS